MNDKLRQLAQLATGQYGAVTRRQIEGAGIGRNELRRRVQSGVLEVIGTHTFRSPFAASSAFTDLAALVLDCGPLAWASGPTAAAVHGFDGFRLKPAYHITVLRGRNVQRAGHHIHTTTVLPLIDRSIVNGVPTVAPTRTLVDLPKFVTAAVLTAAYDGALRDGLTAEHAVHGRIAELRSSGRYGIPKLLEVIEGNEFTRGGHSWLERRFLELCSEAGVPRPVTQQVLSRAQDRLVRVDCRFPGTPVIVELLGYRWHRTTEQMSRDAARMNALVTDGYRPYQFTYHHVTLQPDWVTDQVHVALEPWHGDTPVCVTR